MFQHRQDVRSLEFALKMYNCLLTIFQTHANLPSYIFGQHKKAISREVQKRAILDSTKCGGGVVQIFHLFCPRL